MKQIAYASLMFFRNVSLRRLICAGFALSMVLSQFPPRDIDYIQPTLDGTWKFALNVADAVGWKFGEDIFFSYGPLGFLGAAVGINHHIQITLIVSAILLAIQFLLLLQFIRRSTLHIGQVFAFAFMGTILWVFPPLHFENMLQFTVLLALSVAWVEDRPFFCFLSACLLATLAVGVKFTAAVSCGSAIGVSWLHCFLARRTRWKTIWWLPVLIPSVYLIGYMFYNPSLVGFWRYLRAAQEVSSGYIAAMSFPSPWWSPQVYWAALLCVLLMCFIFLFCSSYRYFPLVLAGPLFVAIKHGIVREDMWHFDMALGVLMPIAFILLIIFPYEVVWKYCRRFWFVLLPAMCLCCVFCLFAPPIRLYLSGQRFLGANYMRFVRGQWGGRLNTLRTIQNKVDNPFSGEAPISDEFVNLIKRDSVTIYPMFLAWGAYHNLNLKVFPMVQAYSAYTPFLDGLTADFFSDPQKAPRYVIFDISAIDGRWALIEAPLTWDAIYRHYEVVREEETVLLLVRREAPLHFALIPIEANKTSLTQSIMIPQENIPIYLQAALRLNWKGKVASVFSKIPEVLLDVTFADGNIQSARCVQNNLLSPTLISFIPRSIEDTSFFLQTGEPQIPVAQIRFSGPGLAYYQTDFTYTLLRAEAAR